MRICLGSDWSPSGSKNLLGELKVADMWNREGMDKAFAPGELCAMATRNPAGTHSVGPIGSAGSERASTPTSSSRATAAVTPTAT